MFDSGTGSNRSTTRRSVIREKCPDRMGTFWRELRASGGLASLGIAAVFCVAAIAIVMLREEVVPYRPGQYTPQDIRSRVDFTVHDKERLRQAREMARNVQPRIYKSNGDVWTELAKKLLDIPDRVAGRKLEEVDKSLRDRLELEGNSGAFSDLLAMANDPKERQSYEKQVQQFIATLSGESLLIVPESEYLDEWKAVARRHEILEGVGEKGKDALYPATSTKLDSAPRYEELREVITRAARVFLPVRAGRIVAYSLHELQPTFVLDKEATQQSENDAEKRVPASVADHFYPANSIIVEKGIIDPQAWQALKKEKEAFVQSLGTASIKSKFGLAGMVLLITGILSYYIARFQPRVLRNRARAWAIAGLLLCMLLLAELAAVGTGPLFVFGIAPTILVAMILAIAYEQRFAIGVATMHAILVTIALDQGIGFFLILWVGVLTCGFMLDEIRTRNKVIEIGGASALTMILATIAAGAVNYDPWNFVLQNCLFTGAAGLAVGFVVLGILPFIEKAFKITTGMTLLELGDPSHPLLRRLALEAPGTYNHSLQVATLSEAAAESIGANALLCRVASYYHDIGKINKADYFIENQTDGRNRHIHLTPNMSVNVIIGHVKDGVALAKEYNLPTVIVPFIQQHHGTTLIEYFFDKAKKQHDQQDPQGPAVSDMQFKYPGPKPKSREIAILMIADAAESASRTLEEPTPVTIEKLVKSLALKRLLDGQFDECDLTMRDLELIERAIIKTLTGIYHGRISYPASAVTPNPKQMPPAAGMKLA